MTRAGRIAAMILTMSVAAAMPASAGRDDDREECRKLAAAPDEPLAGGAGVELEDIDSVAAVLACDSAARWGGLLTPVKNYRLGRAYMAPGPAQSISQALGSSSAVWGVSKDPDVIARLGADVAEWYRSRGEKGLDPSTYAAAAGAGDGDAQMALYFLHSHPYWGRQDQAEAEKWLARALEQTHPAALLVAGKRAIKNPADRESVRQGLRMIFEAASMKHAVAQYEMGDIYLRGELVPENREVGLDWWRIAAVNGVRDAQLYFERNENKKLSTEEFIIALTGIAVASQMIAAWNHPERVQAADGPIVDPELSCGLAMEYSRLTGQCEMDPSFLD
jgi:hypothetical protein